MNDKIKDSSYAAIPQDIFDISKEDFIDSIKERFDNQTVQMYTKVMSRLDYLVSIYDKEIDDFSLQQIKEILTGGDDKSSNRMIAARKSVLARYIKEVLHDEDLLFLISEAKDELILGDRDTIRQLYPKDYDHLYDYILKYMPYIIQQNPFYLMALFFSYFGLEVKEMMSLKSNNVDFIKNRIINDEGVILLDNLPHSFMAIIRQSFITDRIYIGFSKYPIYESEFLIKNIYKVTTGSSRSFNTEVNYIKKTMDFFNSIRNWDFIEDIPFLFSQTNLKKAGYFHKIYMYELVNGAIGYLSQRQYDAIFTKITGHMHKKAANFYLEYENWRDTYYN